MKQVYKMFDPYWTFGKVIGFYPFHLTHDNKVQRTWLHVLHSLLMMCFWIVVSTSYIQFTNSIVVSGSNFSKASSFISNVLLTVNTLLIAIGNLANFKSFEDLIKCFKDFDMRVSICEVRLHF
jgi:hypothetical protein